MSELTFGWENTEDLLKENIKQITDDHWEELALDKQDVPFDVDWDAIVQKEKDTLRWFVARRNNKIIGYILFAAWYPYKYKTTLHISNEAIYVIKTEKNRMWTWLKLIDAAVKNIPRPCKLFLRLRPQSKGTRIGAILERKYNMVCSEEAYSTVLK